MKNLIVEVTKVKLPKERDSLIADSFFDDLENEPKFRGTRTKFRLLSHSEARKHLFEHGTSLRQFRDQGLIGYTKINNVIYYKEADLKSLRERILRALKNE